MDHDGFTTNCGFHEKCHGLTTVWGILTPCWNPWLNPKLQEESLDGPSVEEQKTQRSLRESEVRGSKTNRPGGCGLKVDAIGCEHGEK